MLSLTAQRAKSALEIAGSPAASEVNIRHLDLPQAPRHPGPSNRHPSWELYKEIFQQLGQRKGWQPGPRGRCRKPRFTTR